jgi:hypothetical protein
MTKEFVPYDVALAMKELGFDEPTICSYYRGGEGLYMGNIIHLDDVPAPLYQQAFRWFREKHNLSHNIEEGYFNDGQYAGWINSDGVGAYKTYEEAELACLRKLIEIVKENL